MDVKDLFRQFDRFRRRKMAALEPTLYQLFSHSKYNQSRLLNQDEVKKILIVRNNKRIGNMFFLIPFVKKMRAAYPSAHITLMLSRPWQGAIFEQLGINEFCYTNFSASKVNQFLALISKQNKTTYDLLVTPYSSIEDTLIASMLSAKNKIAPFNERRNCIYTHTFKPSGILQQHAALNRLYIIDELTKGNSYFTSHEIVLTEEELKQGLKDAQSLYQGEHQLIAFFRGARGVKQLSDVQWREIIQTAESCYDYPIKWIEILSPDITHPLLEHSLTYQNKNLRELASFLKNMTTFISCDTGPLHLADASGVKCVGIFTHTDPKVYGLLGPDSLSIKHIDQSTIKSSFLNTLSNIPQIKTSRGQSAY